jgi:hypothetical protein
MSCKISDDTKMIVASQLTIAEMILNIPGPADADTSSPDDPGKDVYEAFKEHLTQLEHDFHSEQESRNQ